MKPRISMGEDCHRFATICSGCGEAAVGALEIGCQYDHRSGTSVVSALCAACAEAVVFAIASFMAARGR